MDHMFKEQTSPTVIVSCKKMGFHDKPKKVVCTTNATFFSGFLGARGTNKYDCMKILVVALPAVCRDDRIITLLLPFFYLSNKVN